MPLLLNVIVALAILGLFLWVIQQIPMDATIARVIRVVVIVVVCLYLLQILVSLFGGGSFVLFPQGRIR